MKSSPPSPVPFLSRKYQAAYIIFVYNIYMCTNLLVISAYTPAVRKLSAVKAIRWAV